MDIDQSGCHVAAGGVDRFVRAPEVGADAGDLAVANEQIRLPLDFRGGVEDSAVLDEG